MISGMTRWAPLILSQAAEPIAADSSITPMPWVLLAIDQVIGGLAVTIVVAAGLWWLARDRRDPLGSAPLRPNRFREDALALTVLLYLMAFLVISGAVKLLTGDAKSILASLLVGSGAQIAGAAACLVVAASRFDGGIRPFCFGAAGAKKHFTTASIIVLVIIAAGLCPVVLDLTVNAVRHFAHDYVFETHPTIEALQDETQPIGIIVALWVGAAVIAPIAEELFFRGLLQTFLVNVLGRRWAAIGVASVLFALAHWAYPHQLPALVLLAVLLGYAYERTGSLMPPIVIHAIFNLKTLIWNALDGLPV